MLDYTNHIAKMTWQFEFSLDFAMPNVTDAEVERQDVFMPDGGSVSFKNGLFYVAFTYEATSSKYGQYAYVFEVWPDQTVYSTTLVDRKLWRSLESGMYRAVPQESIFGESRIPPNAFEGAQDYTPRADSPALDGGPVDDDFFSAASGDDVASAASGDDAASAASGDDAASAASGDDAASAASGDDAASAATGDDAASAATGDDAASAATGDDAASAATGDDAASAATGDDAASAATGDDAASVTAAGDDAASVVAAGDDSSS